MTITTTEETKEWFLAAGTKKVGPMSLRRMQEKLAQGKVPARAKAWKEGMDAWVLVGEIPELSGAAPAAAEPEVARDEPELVPAEPSVAKEPVARLARKSRLSSRLVRAVAPSFEQRYRVDKAETWRAFSIGFDGPRLQLLLLVMGAQLAIVALTLGALYLTPVLGIAAGLGAAPLSLLVMALGGGALSYQTRRRIEEAPVPGPLEALAWAQKHALALVGAPLLLTLLAFVPPILLVLKSLVAHIPSIGAPLAGMSFGVDLALSSLGLFLGVATLLGGSFCSVIVAFEESSARGTIIRLLGVVKTSIVRLLFWQARPNLAIGLMGSVLFFLALLVTLVPAALNYPVLGTFSFGKHFQMPQIELSFGLVGIGLWTAVLFALVAVALLSTKNALTGLVYLACRPGNDELMTRDDYLARRQEAAHEQN